MLILSFWFMRASDGNSTEMEKKKYCISFALIWIIILGFRHPSMGIDLGFNNDYGGYLREYIYIGNLSWKKCFTQQILNYEKGYVIFNKMLNLLSDDYQFLIFACASIPMIFVARWIYKNSDDPRLSSIIYLGLPCFAINFSGLRQALAIAITLWAFECIKQKKLNKFVLIVLLASTFHSSALFFLIAYPLYHVRFNKNMSIATMIIPIIVYIFRIPLFVVFSKVFEDNAVIEQSSDTLLFIVFYSIYIFGVIFGKDTDTEEIGARNLFLIACVCQAFGGIYSTAMRVGYYFMLYLVVLLPKIVYNIALPKSQFRKLRSGMLMYIIILLCFGVFGLYSLSIEESWVMSNPHRFYWQ